MESMLSHGKGAAFFPHISQGTLGAHQQLSIDITGYANMWGEYWDNLICTVRIDSLSLVLPSGPLSSTSWPSASQISLSWETWPLSLGQAFAATATTGIQAEGVFVSRTFHGFSHRVP